MSSYPPLVPADPRAVEVLHFWFGDLPSQDSLPQDKMGLWFTKKHETDALLRDRFAALRAEAVSGKLGEWLGTARGRLAAIILIDQFSRNIFRETPESFAHDGLSLQWSLDGQAQGMDRTLSYAEQLFFNLPLVHSENNAHQDQALRNVERWQAEAPEALQEWLGKVHESTVAHRDFVARFGRFPHRNAILGRESTPEEIEFLKGPNSSF